MTFAETPQANERLRDLQLSYVNDLGGIRTELAYFQDRISGNEITALGAKTLRRLAHRLAGSGGTYGFPKLSSVARRLEHVSESYSGGSTVALKHALDAVLEEIDKIARAAVPANSAEAEPEAPRRPVAMKLRKADRRDRTKPKLLIVEDDPLAASLLTRLLGEDVDVRVADNGMDVLPWVKRDRPDLLLLDNDLPGISGLEILEVLRHHADLRDLKVVMLTGSTDPRVASIAVRSGAKYCFTKPFEPISFAGIIRSLMTETKDLVLIADDDEATRHLLAEHFSRQGVPTAEAMDGEQVMRILGETTPTLLILDRNMPGMNGEAVLEELQRDVLARKIPVMMLTARTSSKDAVEWLKRGAVDFVAKPFSPDMVIERAMKAMGRTPK